MKKYDSLQFVLVSALLVSLGWGLRGYIGGGPLGAMIPGAFIGVWLCLLLRVDTGRAACVAAFAAVGLGFGGDMTYGQTMGFLRESETVLWGVLGSTVKGGIWGMLGGAVIGLGFVAHRLSSRQLAFVFSCFLLAAFAGIALINEPRLLYFSNREESPRPEVWAGLLFGAIALLIALRRFINSPLPLGYALYGLPGGAVGFGGGAALHAWGFSFGQAYASFPWWKLMEFTFGACLGLAYGLYALRAAARHDDGHPVPTHQPPWRALVYAVVIVTLGLVVWNWTAEPLLADMPEHPVLMPLARVLLGYALLGAALCVIAHRYQPLAWQIAITMTFVASIIDLQDDMVNLPNALGTPLARWGLVFLSLFVAAALVVKWQRTARRSLGALLLWLMWACVAVAFLRVGVEVVAIMPTVEEDPWYVIALVEMKRHWLVHGTFFTLALASTLGIALESRRTAA